MAPSACTGFRETCFRKWIPYNDDLRDIVKNEPSHRFLINPASQNTYLYQVEFVREFSEYYFRKPIGELAILDWGCGKGHVSFLLRERGATVRSCDFLEGENDDDSAFGQEIPIIRSARIPVDRLADPVKLPYLDRAFDLVLSFGVLEHVEDDLESLREINRILKPGGLFFCFFLPFVGSWTQYVMRSRGDNYHDRLYTKSKVNSLLKETGFELQDIWHRQLFPKNSVRYPAYRAFESVDQALVRYTPLKYLATNIEFVASRSDVNLT
jgi:SAM-dependent methyltransferase